MEDGPDDLVDLRQRFEKERCARPGSLPDIAASYILQRFKIRAKAIEAEYPDESYASALTQIRIAEEREVGTLTGPGWPREHNVLDFLKRVRNSLLAAQADLETEHWSRLQSRDPKVDSAPTPLQSVVLNERLQARLENARKELQDAVRRQVGGKHPSGLGVAADSGHSTCEEVARILSLELDVKKYVIEEINVWAEAAWVVRDLELFAELVEERGMEAVERGIGMLDPPDRRHVNRTMLVTKATAVAGYWIAKARPQFSQGFGLPGTKGTYFIAVNLSGIGGQHQEPLPFGEYQKWKYSWNGQSELVKNLDEEKRLGGGWSDDSLVFRTYEDDPKRVRPPSSDPLKWVDQWNVAGLTDDIRKGIKAAILRADAEFWNASDVPLANLKTMRSAFSGIAKALFEAGILTEQILLRGIPALVWDSAIAGGWWHLAAETRTEIFPHPKGHYWVWLEENRDWQGLFRPEVQHCRAQLLEAPSPLPQVQLTPVSAKRGRPSQIPDELKEKALAVTGGKARAQILYNTRQPSAQQVKNVPSILRHYQKTRSPKG